MYVINFYLVNQSYAWFHHYPNHQCLALEKQAVGTLMISHREVTGQYPRVCRLHTLVPDNFFLSKTECSTLHNNSPGALTLFCFQNQVQWAFRTANVATEKPASFREQCFWWEGKLFILEHCLSACLLYSGVWHTYREAIHLRWQLLREFSLFLNTTIPLTCF